MFCSNCGKEVSDTALFCTNCGSAISHEKTASFHPTLNRAANNDAPSAMGSAGASAYAGANQAATVLRGCFGCAWDDVMGSAGWLKKILLLGLIMLVPILNLVVLGYAYSWGSRAIRDAREGLPSKVVTGENFKIGFYIALASWGFLLIFGLYGRLVAYVMDQANATLLGILLLFAFVVLLFLPVYLNLGFLRIALYDSPGAAFAIGEIWGAFKRKVGTTLCISYLPAILVGLFSVILTILLSAVLASTVGGGISDILRSPSYAAAMYSAGLASSLATIVLAAWWWLSYVLICFGILLQARGAGHYVKRVCPDWSTGAEAQAAKVKQAVEERVQRVQSDSKTPHASSDLQHESCVGIPVVTHSAFPQEPWNSIHANMNHVNSDMPSAGVIVPANDSRGESIDAAAKEFHAHEEPLQGKADGAVDAYSSDTLVGDTLVGETLVGETFVGETLVGDAQPDDTSEYNTRMALDGDLSNASAQDSRDKERLREYEHTWSGIAPSSGYDRRLQQMEETCIVSAVPSLELEREDGSTCTIYSFPATVGRSDNADVSIPDNPKISRKHARILYDDGAFAIEDLGSANYTRVQGYRIEPYAPTLLSDGDIVTLGTEMLTVRVHIPKNMVTAAEDM